MSYWGAQVIISLFGAIPYIGNDLSLWIRGDFVVADATLNRFFSFHVIAFPMVLLGLVVFHLVALHSVGSNNPDGVEIKSKKNDKGIPLDGIPFHPYYTVKDMYGVVGFLIIFAAVVFYSPEMFGWFLERDNFVPANPLKTPEHIAPLWYFTPFYAILRAVPDKFLGVMAMGASIAMLFLLPWLDRSPVRSIRYKGWIFKTALALFIVSFVGLGYLGTVPATPIATGFSRLFSVLYFVFFLAMPFYSKWDKCKQPPERVKYK
jgi:ubiquinol-cytochrome c reductase cytochrome b subunit